MVKDASAATSASPSVAVAVLTWRGYSVTRACLASMAQSANWPFPVAVIDNASGTGEGVRLAAEFGHPVTAVTLTENTGVVGGYNAGLAWARHVGASYALLVNNDTLWSDTLLVDRLLAAAAPDVAVVGPLVKRPDSSVQSAGGHIQWRTARATALGEGDLPRRDGAYDVAWVDGSCMLVSMEAVVHVGDFASEYFMFWEDVDWCVRAHRAGFRCLVEPRTSITHLGSATVGSNAALRQSLRNKLLFMRRNAGRADNVSGLLAFIALAVPNQIIRQGIHPTGWATVIDAAIGALRWNLADSRRRRAWLIAPASRPSSRAHAP